MKTCNAFGSISRSGHEGFWDFRIRDQQGFQKFCIIDAILLNAIYCNILYFGHCPYLVHCHNHFVYWLPAIHGILTLCISITHINGLSFIFYLVGHIWCLKVYMIICVYDRNICWTIFGQSYLMFKGAYDNCVYDRIICWTIFGQSDSMFKGVYDNLCVWS